MDSESEHFPHAQAGHSSDEDSSSISTEAGGRDKAGDTGNTNNSTGAGSVATQPLASPPPLTSFEKHLQEEQEEEDKNNFYCATPKG